MVAPPTLVPLVAPNLGDSLSGTWVTLKWQVSLTRCPPNLGTVTPTLFPEWIHKDCSSIDSQVFQIWELPKVAASSAARSLQTWRKPPATLLSTTRNTAVHHLGPTNLSQISCNSLLPMITFQPCLSGGGILNVVASFILRPQHQEEFNLQGCFPALLPRWRHQYDQDNSSSTLDAPTQPWRCCPRICLPASGSPPPTLP